MAKLSFIRGAATGKMGEFVGAKWKGINYIRLYAKPANPRTEGQISIRKVFKALSDFANALFAKGILDFFPPARRMTERNSVFKANKQMLSDKIFEAEDLKVCKTNFNFPLTGLNASTTLRTLTLRANAPLYKSGDVITLHVVIYDAVKSVCLGYDRTLLTGISTTFDVVDDAISKIGTSFGSEAENVKVYVFATSLDEDDKKLISDTFCVHIA